MKRATLCLTLLLAVTTAQIAVPSTHPECGSTCTYSNGCCSPDSSCYGSITKRCCSNSAQFCGCYSMRGFCSGYVSGNTGAVNGTDTFGACFDPTKGTCTTDNSANRWVVCRIEDSSCPSNSGYACCTPGQTCFTNSGASFATCAAPTGGPSVIFPQPGQTLVYDTQYTFRFTPVVAGDATFNIITGGNNQLFGTGDVESDGTIALTYTLRSFSPSNGNIDLTFVQNEVSTTVTVYASTTAPTPTQSNEAIDTNDCTPNGCAGGAKCCGGQCYSTGQYTCHIRTDGAYQLCQADSSICGAACYDANVYGCNNDQLYLL